MGKWSIRIRLTFWYSLVLLAGLTLFGCGLWLVVAHSLRASLDDSLTASARGVTTVIQSEYNSNLIEELTEYVVATPEGNLMDIRDPEGRAIVSSKTIRGSGTGGSGFAVQAAPSGRYRTFATTILAAGAPYRILVATPLDPTEATLRRTRLLLLWTIPAVLAIAALGGYWISRRALAPVDEITAAARSIGIQNLSQRLDVPATGDELARCPDLERDAGPPGVGSATAFPVHGRCLA